MLDNDVAAVKELSEAELDMVGAGAALNLDLSHLVNLNLAVVPQTALNIAVLTKGVLQAVTQGVNIHF